MSDDDADPGGPPGPDEDIAERLIGQVAQYDEELARDVRRIIERGAELHSAADELEAAVEERDRRIEELQSTVDEAEQRIDELGAAVEERDDRIDDLQATVAEARDRIDELEAAVQERDDRIDDLREALEEREERIGDLETKLEEGGQAATEAAENAAERIEELETDLEDREEQVADLDEQVADLKERLDDREDEIEDLEKRLKRKQADFQNYKKRQERKREQIKERATEDLVERLLDVRNNLRRALEDDHEDVASLRDGVEMTLREFDRVLEDENVTEIAPEPGEEIDPQHHEVMMRVDSEEPADTVADLYAPGYRMADKVLRPAQVTVSTGPGDDATADGGTDAETDEVDAEGAARATAGDADDDEE